MVTPARCPSVHPVCSGDRLDHLSSTQCYPMVTFCPARSCFWHIDKPHRVQYDDGVTVKTLDVVNVPTGTGALVRCQPNLTSPNMSPPVPTTLKSVVGPPFTPTSPSESTWIFVCLKLMFRALTSLFTGSQSQLVHKDLK